MKFNKKFDYQTKKSKFIAYLLNTQNLDDVDKAFKYLKENHKKATHVCYAYKIVINQVDYVKCFDDGEPGGTAGRPILNVIEKKNLQNLVVFVVRYFGGVKLGSGGLIRAYSKSASGVLN